eukprot:m.291 g.291  ORF g.291 m.291 type:complete len:69 (+) comp1448_c0_seq1:799-1005(+)
MLLIVRVCCLVKPHRYERITGDKSVNERIVRMRMQQEKETLTLFDQCQVDGTGLRQLQKNEDKILKIH